MHLRTLLGLAAALSLLLVSSSQSAEVRNYSFVGEAPEYNFSCGECSGPYWMRGQVEGDFTVSLDFDRGVGTLQTLNAQLSNVEGNFGGDLWQPIPRHEEFLDPSSHDDRYRPPFNGTLTPAEYRPLGPATLTAEHWAHYLSTPASQIPTEVSYWLNQGIGFEPAPANAWILYFDGLIANPGGVVESVGASFLINFEENRAQFSYYIPIDDAVPSIAAASAMLIPEPTGLTLGCLVLCWLGASRRSMRQATRCS